MHIWTTIRDLVASLGAATGIAPCLGAAWDSLAGLGREPKGVAFTVAIVALSAKMAKADGIVTADEVNAFRRVIEVPPAEERNVARLFDLAKVDTAGFESYAARIVKIAEGDAAFLASVLDGLFHIAAADSYIHEAELAFLEKVAEIFGIVDQAFERVVSRFVRRRPADPYRILGIEPDADDAEIRRRWRALALQTHPDRHQANGASTQELAEISDRFAMFHSAWEQIRAERGLH